MARKIIVWISTWTIFLSVCIKLGYITTRIDFLEVYDYIFILTILLAISLATTFSHAYDLAHEKEDDWLIKLAKKRNNTYLHACFSWEIVNCWMVIAPLYCTGLVVFISSQSSQSNIMNRILLYSIFSLVISLSIYVIKPKKRATIFQKKYNTIHKELLLYLNSEMPNDCDRKKLINLLAESESL